MIPDQLKKQSYFTTEEANELGLSSRMISYYTKQGQLERVKRGVYRYTDFIPSKDFQWEDLAVAASNISEGVICLISALAYYDLTEEFMREYWIATPNQNSKASFPNTRIVRMRNTELGRRAIRIAGMKVSIFDRERTIVDSFRLLDIEVAIKALKFYMETTKKPDFKKIYKYAKELRVEIEPYLIPYTVI